LISQLIEDAKREYGKDGNNGTNGRRIENGLAIG
jgi:hypothetical protein